MNCSFRFVCQLSKLALTFALSAFAIVASAAAAELRTYTIENDQPRLFHFAGGLIDSHASAQLAGSFEIAIETDGAATLTRFDVQLVDILSQGSFDPGWTEGQSLAPMLFANPIGLTGLHDPASIRLGVFPDLTGPPMRVGPLTNISLIPGDGRLATLNIVSLPEFVLDGPSFMTASPGFMVQLVPEPSAWSIAFFGVMAAMMNARNLRKFEQNRDIAAQTDINFFRSMVD